MANDVPGYDEIEPLYQGSFIRYVRRLFTAFLQGVYNNVKGEYHWAEDPNEAGLYIAGTVPIDAAAFGKKPCILVARAPYIFAGAGVGGIDSVEPSTGAVNKSDLINSTAIFHHISTKEAEAEELAAFTADMLWTHFAFLAKYYIITMGNITIAGTAPVGSLVEGDTKGLITIPVTLPFRIPRACRIEPLDAPVLAAFTAKLGITGVADVGYPSKRTQNFPADPADIRTKGPRTLLVGASQPLETVRSSVRVGKE